MDRETLLEKAQELRKASGYVDIIRLARDLKIDVLGVVKRDEGFNANINFDQPSGKYTILVNQAHPVTRQRFSIAHELAHYVLHEDLIREHGSLHRDGSSDIEKETDELAAEILMPEDAVKEYIEVAKIPTDSINEQGIKKVAGQFRVSNAVAVIRLREIGYNVPYVPLS